MALHSNPIQIVLRVLNLAGASGAALDGNAGSVSGESSNSRSTSLLEGHCTHISQLVSTHTVGRGDSAR
jgi:hypothetical protein